MHDIIQQLDDKRAAARLGGGAEAHRRAARQGQAHRARAHRAAARRRTRSRNGTCSSSTAAPTSAWTTRQIPGDGVVTGYGTINGRLVFVFSQDFTVFGGSLSEAHAEKICKVMDQAMKVGAPVIGLNDSGGARIQEGVASLGGYADVFQRNVLASGVIPQISLIMGPCAGGAVYSPAMTDFIFMVKDSSYMFVTGPEVREDGDARGGDRRGARRRAHPHDASRRRRPARSRTTSRRSLMLRRFFNYLPLEQPREAAACGRATDPADRLELSLDTLVPDNPNKPYDMKELILKVVDDGDFFELQPDYAKNIVIGFARMDGATGRHRRQPAAGAGRLPRHQERDQGGALRALLRRLQHPDHHLRRRARLHAGHGAGVRRHHQARRQAALRLRRGTVPKVTVITRKAYGGAYDVMSSKHLRGDVNFAWPTAEIAVMGAEGRGRDHLPRGQGRPGQDRRARRRSTARSSPTRSSPARRGFIDDVIMPHETRKRICRSLAMLRDKKLENPWRKHGNIPL